MINKGVSTSDGGLWVVGSSNDNGLLIRMDVSGDVVQVLNTEMVELEWLEYPNALTSVMRAAAVMPDGGLMVVGTGLTAQPVSYSGYRLCTRLDPNGSILGVDGLGSWWPHGMNGVTCDDNGNAFGIGVLTGLSELTRGQLFSLDPSTGEILSILEIAGEGANATAIVPMPGGGVVFGGGVNYSNAYIIRLNSNLQELWGRTWGDVLINTMDEASGVLMVGGNLDYYSDPILTRMDIAGAVVWSKAIGLTDGTLSDVHILPNGKVIAIGNVTGPENYGWASQFDPDGTLDWCMRYGANGENVTLRSVHHVAGAGTRLVGTAGNDLLVLAIDDADGTGPCMATPLSCTVEEYQIQPGGAYSLTTNLQNTTRSTGTTSLSVLTGDLSCASSGAWWVSGTLFVDLNGNGVRELGEPGYGNWPMSLATTGISVLTDPNGFYELGTFLIGDQSLGTTLPSPAWAFTTSPTLSITTDGTGPSQFPDRDIGIRPVIDTTEVVGSMTLGTSPCGAPVNMHVSIFNAGTTTPNGVVSLTLDPIFTFVSSSVPPDSIVSDTYYWSYATLPWNVSDQWTITLVNPPVTSIGDPYEHHLEVFADVDGQLTPIAEHTLIGSVSCSYDPNDKTVDRDGYGDYGVVNSETEWVTYTIRFQNTGTAAAQVVLIEDPLSMWLEPTSLQVLATSHPLTRVEVTSGGIATFLYEGIQLPDSGTSQLESQGFVKFRVRPIDAQQFIHLGRILNTAYIHFDQNPAVVTNTTQKYLVNCANAPYEAVIESLPFDPEVLYAVMFNPALAPDTITNTVQWYLNGVEIPEATNTEFQPVESGMYTATMTNQLGCTLTTEPFWFVVTGTVNISGQDLRLQPNPFNSTARLISEKPFGPSTFAELCDVTGKRLRTFPSNGGNEIQLDRTGLAPGLYLVRVLEKDRLLSTARVQLL